MDEMHEKLGKLKIDLAAMGSVAIAFSSGVDSTFLLKIAHDVRGSHVIAVTAKSCSFPQRELLEAQAFCQKEKIDHVIVESEELDIEGFRQNPKNRCYLCKRELFTKIREIADVELFCRQSRPVRRAVEIFFHGSPNSIHSQIDERISRRRKRAWKNPLFCSIIASYFLMSSPIGKDSIQRLRKNKPSFFKTV